MERLKDIVTPKVKGFVCITSHSDGLKKIVKKNIEYVKSQDYSKNKFNNALVIGGSTGYGFASSLILSEGIGANVISLGFEREPSLKRTASSGYYQIEALKENLSNKDKFSFFNLDAFSDETKKLIANEIKNKFGKLELLVYSVASPRREDPETHILYQSVLKPVGEKFSSKTVDIYKGEVKEVSLEPAKDEEVQNTIKVMGGEDWERWIDFLQKENLLADNFRTIAYSYIGPSLTWAIYKNGSIGKAKEDLYNSSKKISEKLKSISGKAYISVNKAIVTQASSAIPVVPLYLSLLYKVMKEKGTHEGALEQISRLFSDFDLKSSDILLDSEGKIRLDSFELANDVQEKVLKMWDKIDSQNILTDSDIQSVKKDFMNLFGFEVDGVDYEKETLI